MTTNCSPTRVDFKTPIIAGLVNIEAGFRIA
jgi:hypothetical protein